MVDARGRAVGDDRRVLMNAVGPGWFSTYGIQLRAGRDVSQDDTASALPVVVVNETYVQKFFPGQNVIGAKFEDGSDSSRTAPISGRTIVGVVADVVYGSVRNAMPATAYVPLAQSAKLGVPGRSTIQVSVRARNGQPARLSREIGTALSAVNPNLAFSFRVVGDAVRSSFARERLIAMLSGFFGVLAMLLAGLGLYGVTSYTVNCRRTEIGIRMTLGATPHGVLRLVLSRVAFLVACGIVVGGAMSIWLSRFVATFLYGLEPRDPVTFGLAVIVLLAVAALAGGLPAYRASKVDPWETLRAE
jgi:ABC-type antimicrobial peptide transport system permease subunit